VKDCPDSLSRVLRESVAPVVRARQEAATRLNPDLPFGVIYGDRWGRKYEQFGLHYDIEGRRHEIEDFVGPIPEEHLLAQMRAEAEARTRAALQDDYELRQRARRIARAEVVIEAAKAVIAEFHRPHSYRRPHAYYHQGASCGIPDDGLGDMAFEHHLLLEVDPCDRLDAGEDAMPLMLILDDKYSPEYSTGERP
jgi:hypothetical protein